jgi:HEAT repeat protein
MAEQPVALDTFLQELADPATPFSASKLTALSNLGPADASAFLDGWAALPDERRQQVVRELVDLAEDNVELNFDAVFLLTLADADVEVRRTSVQGLWEYDGRDLIDPLVGLLQSDEDAGVRAEAALALGRYVLQAEFDVLRSQDGEKVEQALIRAFEDESDAAEVRGRALESLGARSEPWVRDLIEEAYDSGDRRLRISAIHAMGRNCDPDWLIELLPSLEDDDAEVRFEAATALGSIGEEAAVVPLIPLLEDEDAEVQRAAIDALGQIGGGAAKAALEALAERVDENEREPVLAALAEAGFADDPLGVRVVGGNGRDEDDDL